MQRQGETGYRPEPGPKPAKGPDTAGSITAKATFPTGWQIQIGMMALAIKALQEEMDQLAKVADQMSDDLDKRVRVLEAERLGDMTP